jgi:hypothetical protein
VPNLEQKWETQFALLQGFLGAHGRLPRQFCEDPAEQSVGSWMKSQRRSAKAGRLTVGRIHRLRALPVPGVLDKVAPPDRIAELEAFVSANGRLPKSTAPEGSEELRLGQYMIHYLRPKLKNGALSKEIASRAARIPGVTRFSYQPDQDERLQEVRDFIAVNGFTPRTSPTVPAAELRLYRWIRNTLEKPPAPHSPTILARVESLRTLMAESPNYRAFNAGLLVAYAEQHIADHGVPPTPGAAGSPQRRTYNWLLQRREKSDADAYGPELGHRISAILALPARTAVTWESRLDELHVYIKENGKLPTGFDDGPIYRWLCHQRSTNRQRTLTAEREKLLRAVPGVLPKRPPGRPRQRL